MAEQPLRAGIIGLGVGRAHAKGYLGHHGAQLVAICDMDETRLHEFSTEWHIPTEGRYTDYKRMLAEAKLDIVSICLPNFLHSEVTIAALDAGVNVLCEKPMAPSVDQAQAMIAAAGRNHKQLMIAYNYRYRADVQWIRRVVTSGQLGNIYHIYAAWRRETGIPGRGWFGKKEMSGGGALIDLGVHVLDLMMWMLDFPGVTTVSGDTHSLFGPRGMKIMGHGNQDLDGPFDVDDGAVGFIRFANGANAVLEATWAEHRQPQDDLIHIEIQGTNGTIVLNIENYGTKDTLRFYTEIEDAPVTIIPTLRDPGPQGHEKLVIEAIRSLTQQLPPPSDGFQGLAAVEVLQAMYESAKTGCEIVLSRGDNPKA